MRSYWEDVLVDFLGLHWRGIQKSSSWAEWKAKREDFIVHVCNRWNLQLCGLFETDTEAAPKRQKTSEVFCKERLVFRGSIPETDELMDTVAPLIDWCRSQRCFAYVVDSQALQQVVCGQARLQDAYYEPLVARIVDRLVDHYCCKWTPPRVWGEPVRWMDRSHNKVADGLADLTMDNGYSWHKEFAFTTDISGSNLVIQTDGGLREGQCAAAAWIIGAWAVNGQTVRFEPLVGHGSWLEASCSAFAAEAIALDEASAEATQIIRRCA